MDSEFFWALLLVIGSMVVVGLVMPSCTDPDRTVSTLEAQGFTDIEPGSYRYFGCGQSDAFHTEFTATNSNGQRVEGLVCCGLMKSCTVRF